MKRLIIAAAIANISAPAYAQCTSGSATAVLVESWSAAPNAQAGSTTVKLTLKNAMDTGFRLIDGDVGFRDVLGRTIGEFELDRGILVGAGETFAQQIRMIGLEDLTRLHKDDIEAYVCTRAVVKEDGTVNRGPRGADIDTQITQSEMAALATSMRRCWNPPFDAIESGLAVELRVTFSQDGSVASVPQILSNMHSDLVRSTALAAQRAVQQCSPYSLPVEKYESWQQVDVTFDSREM